MTQWRISRLRRIDPRPFGLTADPDRPPLTLGSESGSAGAIEEISAAITRSAVPLGSLGLMYGDYLDLAMPLVEVTTHWDGRGWFAPARPPGVPPSAWEQIPAAAWDLGDTERRDDAIARQDWKALGYPQRVPVDGPFTQGSAEIVVSGSPRSVPVVSYRHYTALSFSADEATVTVISRHPLPEMPRFDPVTDLEVFYAGYARSLEQLAARAKLRDRSDP
jgi:hypothetical protein